MITWENPWSASPNLLWRLRTLPAYLIWSLIGFVSGWVQTRRVRHLLLGIPAILLSFPIITFTVHSKDALSTENVQRYLRSARDRLKENQLDQAEFYINRLNALTNQNDQILMTRAEIATARKNSEQAEAFYRQMLANSDRALDATAHRQVAIIEMMNTANPNSQQASQAVEHLKQSLTLNPADIESHELLTKVYLARGDFRSVAEHLVPVAARNPAMQIELARIFQKLGRPAKMEVAATKAANHYAESIPLLQAALNSEGEQEAIRSQWIKEHLSWSEALLMLNKVDEAARIITQAVDKHSTQELRRQLAGIYLRQANAVPASGEHWEKRWELITLSRNYAPESVDSLVAMANVAAHASHEVKLLAQREIQPYLDSGEAPAAVFYLMGTAAAADKNWETALSLLRKSVEMEPKADVTWNNLAHTLYSQPMPDWREAERCIQRAIELQPTPAVYHETRGRIMIGLQKWPEAVQELEFARLSLPAQAQLHQGLSMAYQQLGDEDLAEYHRARQVALSQQSETPVRP